MSTLASAQLRDGGVRARRRGAPRPVLTAVPAPAPSHGGMLLVCAGLLFSGLLTLLFLNMALAEGSFTVHELQRTAGELSESEDALEQSITAVSSPAALASRAGRMGMVPAASPAFLRLEDGAVLGVAEPATDEAAFSVDVTPAPTAPAASAAAQSATAHRP
jgi:hypothetical protein